MKTAQEVKRAIKATINNKRMKGASNYAILIYLTSLKMLWTDREDVLSVIKGLESDVTYVTRRTEGRPHI